MRIPETKGTQKDWPTRSLVNTIEKNILEQNATVTFGFVSTFFFTKTVEVISEEERESKEGRFSGSGRLNPFSSLLERRGGGRIPE